MLSGRIGYRAIHATREQLATCLRPGLTVSGSLPMCLGSFIQGSVQHSATSSDGRLRRLAIRPRRVFGRTRVRCKRHRMTSSRDVPTEPCPSLVTCSTWRFARMTRPRFRTAPGLPEAASAGGSPESAKGVQRGPGKRHPGCLRNSLLIRPAPPAILKAIAAGMAQAVPKRAGLWALGIAGRHRQVGCCGGRIACFTRQANAD